jgi:hypothetical protein
MGREGDHAEAIGAEAARKAAVLRPLVQEYLSGTGSLESGIHDAVCELGVSRATDWRWIRRLAYYGGWTREDRKSTVLNPAQLVRMEAVPCGYRSRQREIVPDRNSDAESDVTQRASRDSEEGNFDALSNTFSSSKSADAFVWPRLGMSIMTLSEY